MKVLFVDCCMRNGEESRTKQLCNIFLKSLKKAQPDCEIETVILKDIGLKPLYIEDVEKRNELLNKNELDAPMLKLARQFAQVDRVVIGAPYWDLAFPSLLKVYIEHIFVGGITFTATEKGLQGLSKGEKALFIQTAGGFVAENDPGTEYLKYVLATLGIKDFKRVSADFIDIIGVNVAEKLETAAAELQKLAEKW